MKSQCLSGISGTGRFLVNKGKTVLTREKPKVEKGTGLIHFPRREDRRKKKGSTARRIWNDDPAQKGKRKKAPGLAYPLSASEKGHQAAFSWRRGEYCFDQGAGRSSDTKKGGGSR